MTKQNWVDASKKWLVGGGYAPPELRNINDPRYIEKMLSMAFDTYFDSSKTIKDEVADEEGKHLWKYASMTKRFIQPVLEDTLTGQLYVELPKQIMSVNNNQGVVLLCPTKEQSTAFLPRRTLGSFFFNDLDVSTLGLIHFNLEEKRLYLDGDIDKCWESLLMKLAVKFEELEDDDWVNVPDGDSTQIFQSMLQIMSNKLPSDISDDNTVSQKLNIK